MHPDIEYLLSRKFSSDKLENAFGKLRQLGGYAYQSDVLHCIEGTKKMRIQRLMNWRVKNQRTGKELPTYEYTDEGPPCDVTIHAIDLCSTFFDLPSNDQLMSDQLQDLDKSALLYVSGYVAHSISKKMLKDPCNDCRAMLIDDFELHNTSQFFHYLQRGGLKCPSEWSYELMKTGVALTKSLVSHEILKKSFMAHGVNQKKVLTHLLFLALEHLGFDLQVCCENCGRSVRSIVELFASPMFNCILMNWAKNKTFLWSKEYQEKIIANKVVADARQKRKAEALSQLSQSEQNSRATTSTQAKKLFRVDEGVVNLHHKGRIFGPPTL